MAESVYRYGPREDEPGAYSYEGDPFGDTVRYLTRHLPGPLQNVANVYLPQSLGEVLATYAMHAAVPETVVLHPLARLALRALVGGGTGAATAKITGLDPQEEGIGGAVGAVTEHLGEREARDMLESGFMRRLVKGETPRARKLEKGTAMTTDSVASGGVTAPFYRGAQRALATAPDIDPRDPTAPYLTGMPEAYIAGVQLLRDLARAALGTPLEEGGGEEREREPERGPVEVERASHRGEAEAAEVPAMPPGWAARWRK